MVTRSLAVIQTPPKVTAEIEQDLGARDKIEAALAEIDKELAAIASDAARQFAAQSAGKSLSDAAALAVTVEQAAVTRRQRAQEKKKALEFLLPAVNKQLEQWRISAPDELIAVLDRKIAEQTPIVGQEKEEADRAQQMLDRLKRDRNAVKPASSKAGAVAVPVSPATPPATTPAASAATPAAPPTSTPAASSATATAGASGAGGSARRRKTGGKGRGKSAAPQAASRPATPPAAAPASSPSTGGSPPGGAAPSGGAGGSTS